MNAQISRRRFVGAGASAALALLGRRAPAAAAAGIDRVEEDWELVIESPDLIAEGPQLTTSMSPTGDIEGLFVAFNLNYRGQSPYRSGGLEVVAFNGEVAMAVSTQGSGLLSTDGEQLTWTQQLRVSGGTLSYQIVGGESTTWGKFGQGSGTNLGVTTAAGLSTLDAYDPAVSVARSGAGWQPNRVRSMTLVRVRYYAGGQLVALDETARPVELAV